MRIFLAGAAGAIGRQLVPMLVADGHEVHGTTRSSERAAWLRSVGADPVVLDVFDEGGVRAAVAEVRPDIVVEELTDLAAGTRPDDLMATARLRRIGTRHLVDAMLASGVPRLVAQSGAWLYAPGSGPHREDDPLLDPAANPGQRTLPGILELERLALATPRIEGTVLRYGFFYGPGTVSPERTDRPSVHVAAAARATALAVASPARGVFNIVDDGDDVSTERARSVLGWDPAGF
ncbi:MAG TPA: NAD(P)-dependent oxidoreductase [Candidatus Limnocylindrales bacterium]|nr:NAD(P)-dependent oxidoreductase [Candidatus Limnocylindrales bacterium]